MKIQLSRVYYIVTYGSIFCSILIILASFRFRHEDPSEFISQIEYDVQQFQQVQEAETTNFEQEYERETPYRPETLHIGIQYEGLNKRNPFKVLIERPRPPDPTPKEVPDFDITWATRNWRILGPMQGIPAMNIPDRMLLELEANQEPVQVAQGDTLEAQSRHHGNVYIEIREINLKEFSLTVGFYDEEKQSDHTRKLSMFGL